ncbi:MAG: hypothetical protein ACK52I_20840 [Pseudomonadota bacterium]|jgi:hypothetical protein
MIDLTKLRAEMRAGLDGVTPGSFYLMQNAVLAATGSTKHASYITRCSPENVRALLDAIDAAEAHDYRKMTALGVGKGSGSLFVYGEYEAIKAAQALVFRAEKAERERDEARAAEHLLHYRLRCLEDAADQCLDDMGKHGHSVCGAAKAQLRYALGPDYLTDDERHISYVEALRILIECDEMHGKRSPLRDELAQVEDRRP